MFFAEAAKAALLLQFSLFLLCCFTVSAQTLPHALPPQYHAISPVVPPAHPPSHHPHHPHPPTQPPAHPPSHRHHHHPHPPTQPPAYPPPPPKAPPKPPTYPPPKGPSKPPVYPPPPKSPPKPPTYAPPPKAPPKPPIYPPPPKSPPKPPTYPPPTKPPTYAPPPKAPPKPPTYPPPSKPPTKPPIYPPPKPPTKPPTYPPLPHPPAKPPTYPKPTRSFVAVQGVVYCKSCKYKGSNTLMGAEAIHNATVKLTCKNTKYKQEATARTDENGYFFLQAPKTITSFGAHKCTVSLLSSPLASCSKPTDLHGGLKGGALRPEKPFIAKKLPFVLYTVGPFAFEPKCY